MSTINNKFIKSTLQIAAPPRKYSNYNQGAQEPKRNTHTNNKQKPIGYKAEYKSVIQAHYGRYYKCRSYGTNRIYEWKRYHDEIDVYMKNRDDNVTMSIENFLNVFTLNLNDGDR